MGLAQFVEVSFTIQGRVVSYQRAGHGGQPVVTDKQANKQKQKIEKNKGPLKAIIFLPFYLTRLLREDDTYILNPHALDLSIVS